MIGESVACFRKVIRVSGKFAMKLGKDLQEECGFRDIMCTAGYGNISEKGVQRESHR